mmetsp:Transcript_19863/g.24480  ORF Transcript_19863/g.24480 Transcript_19863/m.24480 type:complete len:110 (-) Transcript_19863:18-347(-)
MESLKRRANMIDKANNELKITLQQLMMGNNNNHNKMYGTLTLKEQKQILNGLYKLKDIIIKNDKERLNCVNVINTAKQELISIKNECSILIKENERLKQENSQLKSLKK